MLYAFRNNKMLCSPQVKGIVTHITIFVHNNSVLYFCDFYTVDSVRNADSFRCCVCNYSGNTYRSRVGIGVIGEAYIFRESIRGENK